MTKHVTIEQTGKSIKLQMMIGLIVWLVGVIALLNDSYVFGAIACVTGVSWFGYNAIFRKWWHHG